MTKAIDVVKAHQSTEGSKWKKQAQWHVDNWGWLKHSARIALKVKERLNALGLTQKELAERMGCSQQYVSLILKGKENLTLETIAKLEKALDSEILIYTRDLVSGYNIPFNQPSRYLSEAEGPEYGDV